MPLSAELAWAVGKCRIRPGGRLLEASASRAFGQIKAQNLADGNPMGVVDASSVLFPELSPVAGAAEQLLGDFAQGIPGPDDRSQPTDGCRTSAFFIPGALIGLREGP